MGDLNQGLNLAAQELAEGLPQDEGVVNSGGDLILLIHQLVMSLIPRLALVGAAVGQFHHALSRAGR